MYEISEMHFHLLGRNGFHVKAKNEWFTAVGLHCLQNHKYNNFALSFSRKCQKSIAPKGILHMQHEYFSSFNQSNHWFVGYMSLTLMSSFLNLPYFKILWDISSRHQQKIRWCWNGGQSKWKTLRCRQTVWGIGVHHTTLVILFLFSSVGMQEIIIITTCNTFL